MQIIKEDYCQVADVVFFKRSRDTIYENEINTKNYYCLAAHGNTKYSNTPYFGVRANDFDELVEFLFSIKEEFLLCKDYEIRRIKERFTLTTNQEYFISKLKEKI